MLDADEIAAYEAWKFDRLENGVDVSVKAYNEEMERQALAYEEGVRASVNETDLQKINSLLSANPYRQPGMRGHLARSLVSPSAPVPSTTE